MQILSDPRQVQAAMLERRAHGQVVGFVPTMGFLHRGHASLMDLARRRCDHLVVSIYVNPLQFGPGEDLDRYPRDPEGDAALCRGHGVDLLFMPPDLYEPGHATTVRVAGLTQGLCGRSRPTHFDGVTTVVARLFGLVQPTLAVFGEKDWQQLVVVRAMCRLQGRNLAILGEPTARDPDGLAMSSRNQHLTPADRAAALSLSQALKLARGIDDPRAAEAAMVDHMRAAGAHPEYAAVRDADTLDPTGAERDRPARVLVAARVGTTRLLDNAAWPGSTDTLD
jgi:pantoate--beta-alanine ligase